MHGGSFPKMRVIFETEGIRPVEDDKLLGRKNLPEPVHEVKLP